jgi:hypothetical protein
VRYTFSPKLVVAISLNVTATAIGVAQVEVVGDVEVDAVPVGKEVAVTEEYVPLDDDPEHCPGREFAEEAPQEAGIMLLRLAFAVKKAAYDHVKSAALRGFPSDFEYCSARAPLCGVYFCARPMYPSA